MISNNIVTVHCIVATATFIKSQRTNSRLETATFTCCRRPEDVYVYELVRKGLKEDVLSWLNTKMVHCIVATATFVKSQRTNSRLETVTFTCLGFQILLNNFLEITDGGFLAISPKN